ncbi:MAG: ArnT family glycosyltransferase [Woeseiaceae bacterium]
MRSAAARDVLLILGLGLLILAAGLGLRDPWPPDEPRFALIARDMVESGRWLFPMRAGELYPDKPPLFMWLIGVCYALSGSLRFSFLLPSLMAGLLTLLLVYDLGRRLWTRETGLAAALLLLATIQFPLHARSGQIDAVLTFWTTLALYGLLRHLLSGPAWLSYGIAWIAAGLGIITKGVGFLPLLVFIPYGYARLRGWPKLFRTGSFRSLAGPVLLLLGVSVWLAPMLLAVHQNGSPVYLAYRDEILFGQTAGRYVSPGGHIKPPWYYLVEVIPLYWLPLSVLLPWLVPHWAAQLGRKDARLLLLLGWVVLVIVFFTLSPAKRAVYLLPALPAAALAAGPYLSELIARHGVRRFAFALSILATSLPALALSYFRLIDPEAGDRIEAIHGIEPWLPVAAMLVVFAVIVCATRIRRAIAGFAGVLAAYWLLAGWWLMPAIDPAMSGAPFMARVESLLEPDERLGIVRYKEKFILHAARPVTTFGYRRPDIATEFADAAAWLARSSGRKLLVGQEGWRSCFSEAKAVPVGFESQREWFLIGRDDVQASCIARGDSMHAIGYAPRRLNSLAHGSSD